MKCCLLRFNCSSNAYRTKLNIPAIFSYFAMETTFFPRLKMNFLGETFNETNNHHRVFCSSPVLPAINFNRDEDTFIRRSCSCWLKWND